MVLSLRNKMLIFSFGVVALLTGLTFFTIDRFVSNQVDEAIQTEVDNTLRIFRAFMQERAGWLRTQSLVVAEDPRFTATLDIVDPDFDSQALTVLREAKRFQTILGSDRFMVTNRDGEILSEVRLVSDSGGSLERFASVREAAAGRTGIVRGVFQGKNYSLVSVPFHEGQENGVPGAVSLGFEELEDAEGLVEDLQTALREELEEEGHGPGLLARNLQRTFGADLAAVTAADGTIQSLIVRQTGIGGRLDSLDFRKSLEQGSELSRLHADDGHLVQTVFIPVWSLGHIVGTLSTGFEIDDQLALDLKEMTQSEVTFLLGDEIVASSWQPAERAQLSALLMSRSDAFWEAPTTSELVLGSDTYVSRLEMLGESGDGEAYFLIQRSRDQAMGFLFTLERILIGIGIFVLATAAALGYAGTARITRPLGALLEGTRKLAGGDLRHHIEVTSGDEIGELARSFNEMATSLGSSQEDLAESERRHRDLFYNAQDVVYTADLQMRFTSINQAGIDLFGYSKEEVIGKSLFELVDPSDLSSLEIFLRADRQGGAGSPIEVGVMRKGGETVALEIVQRGILKGGESIGYHGIARDITARRERERVQRRLREQVLQSEKLQALGELAAGVAHNFNNVLTGVIGYSQLLEMAEDLPPHLKEYARRVSEAGQRCATVVRRIQKFGRPADRSETQIISLNDVVRDIIEMTRPKWKTAPEREGRSVQLIHKLGDIPSLEGTASAWEEIISNLIFNAVDAMPAGGDIRIETRLEGTEVVFEIADSGTGMSEETRRRIFEPFFSTKGPELGTGLGLSTVWGLVENQKGRIEVESQLGKGTVFTIRVPLPEMISGEAPRELAAAGVQGLRILVVDDDPSTRDLLPRLMEGNQVATVGDARTALERISRQSFDILITDWSMEGMSGLELASEVKRSYPGIIIILMTGWATAGTPAAFSSEIDFLLSKPVLINELRQVLAGCQSRLKVHSRK